MAISLYTDPLVSQISRSGVITKFSSQGTRLRAPERILRTRRKFNLQRNQDFSFHLQQPISFDRIKRVCKHWIWTQRSRRNGGGTWIGQNDRGGWTLRLLVIFAYIAIGWLGILPFPPFLHSRPRNYVLSLRCLKSRIFQFVKCFYVIDFDCILWAFQMKACKRFVDLIWNFSVISDFYCFSLSAPYNIHYIFAGIYDRMNHR